MLFRGNLNKNDRAFFFKKFRGKRQEFLFLPFAEILQVPYIFIRSIDKNFRIYYAVKSTSIRVP